jgi:hypothetical protein
MNAAAPTIRAERWLAGVLRLDGAITCCAVLAIFMPLDRMADVHRALGLGRVPDGPVFEYLARTVSFMYVVHGALCLRLSADVRRFGPVITLLASLQLAFAAAVVWIDEKAGMPRAWTVTECALVTTFSAAILGLRLACARRERP